MRALIVTNMYPSSERPARGIFVRDQVAALQRLGADVEVHAFDGGGKPAAYVRAAGELRRRFRATRFDVVHAHFGLTTWPALAVAADRRAVTLHGTDLADPRSRRITLAALRTQDIVATVSEGLAAAVPAAALRRDAQRAVLPCGVALDRFASRDRAQARRRLGLHPTGRYLLFPADPARAEKRYDRAVAIARGVELPVLTLGAVPPHLVPDYVNAADCVLVTSDREGFGLATLEALACDVPVLATPVGIAPVALDGIAGTLCAPFDAPRWTAALEPHLVLDDPRIAGRSSAERWSADRMAAAVLGTWRER